MDISVIQPSEITREITHPTTGEPIGVAVTVVQLESDQTKTDRRRLMDRRAKAEARNKHLKAAEIEDSAADILYSCMVSWDWRAVEDSKGRMQDAPTFEGKVPDFNRANVKKVFAQLPWFQSQVDQMVEEARDFFKESKTK